MKSLWLEWLEHWIASWLDMICGLISVITFCAWRPWWDFDFRAWSGIRRCKREIEREEMK